MPQLDRPSSPEDPIADQYFIYRLEHDLYELFEEQQLLLDIVAQQQERLERHIQIQRMALIEPPPAREATPESEVLEIYEIVIEVEREPEPASEPQMEPQSEPESQMELKPEPDSEPELKAESKLDLEPKRKSESKLEVIPEPESKVELELEAEPKLDMKSESESKLEVKPESESKLEMEQEPESKLEVEQEPESKLEVEPERKSESELEVVPEPVLEVQLQLEVGLESEPKAESKLEVEPEPESKLEVEPEPESKLEVEPEPESKLEAEPERESKLEVEPESKLEMETDRNSESELEVVPEPVLEVELELEVESEPTAEVEPERKVEWNMEVIPEVELEFEVGLELEVESEPMTEMKTESKLEVEPEPKVEMDTETESEPDSESKLELQPESESETESETEPESKLEHEPNAAVEPKQLAVNGPNEQQQEAQPNGSDTVPPLPPPRCICNQVQRPARRNSRNSVEDTKIAQCTPPKRNGLGYDAPFPYPKRMAKTRERRALFIFTLVDNLVLQLQRCMSLAETGAPPMPICSARSDQLTIAELDNEAEQENVLQNDKEKDTKKEDEKKKDEAEEDKAPAPIVNTSTGTLPKQNYNPIERAVKPSKGSKPSKRLRKKPVKESELLEVEIDLDCEFGMEHIEKFRANRIREDNFHAYNSPARRAKREKSADGQMNAETDDIEGDVLAAALASLAINEETNVQQVRPLMPNWFDSGLAPPKAQLETRACSPDLKSFPLLSTGLQSNNFINMMPSTSAQARALSMAMSITVHRADSLRSSLSPSPLDMQAFLNQPLDSFNQMQALPERIIGVSVNPSQFGRGFDINGSNGRMSKLSNNGNNLNAAPPFGGMNRLNRIENIHRPISTEPPSPPPNLFGNHFIYTPITEPVIPFNQDKGDDNDTQATPLTFCGQEYTASSPGDR
ncbi:PREDICTED: cyclic nucleotide-gated cation channel beta-1 [Drosophila arizonae]|uniref:Cyclic nucleotide-gated cation channel beta-1 n=1 Tax=Drosophila arizonae TaxID=7263 RepID=A0ABM1PQT0_DROAR|nr:PREDICTED: cyclic nucleotide-gated cation channel beta-1 [Drosophila arizonae]